MNNSTNSHQKERILISRLEDLKGQGCEGYRCLCVFVFFFEVRFPNNS